MLRQREIVLLPIIFSDMKTSKDRPVLVLSKTEYNLRQKDVLVAPLTSNLYLVSFSRVITMADLETGALPKESKVRMDKLFTVQQSMIKKRFGMIKPDVFSN